jgi:hypothetical protein
MRHDMEVSVAASCDPLFSRPGCARARQEADDGSGPGAPVTLSCAAGPGLLAASLVLCQSHLCLHSCTTTVETMVVTPAPILSSSTRQLLTMQ